MFGVRIKVEIKVASVRVKGIKDISVKLTVIVYYILYLFSCIK